MSENDTGVFRMDGRTCAMTAPVALAHYRRLETQHGQKNSLLNNDKPQFGIDPLNWNCPSELYIML
jgi:hypothetical protein